MELTPLWDFFYLSLLLLSNFERFVKLYISNFEKSKIIIPFDFNFKQPEDARRSGNASFDKIE